jgi:hypothetical protein
MPSKVYKAKFNIGQVFVFCITASLFFSGKYLLKKEEGPTANKND